MKTHYIPFLVLLTVLINMAGCSDDSDKFTFPQRNGKLKAVIYENWQTERVRSDAYKYDSDGRLIQIQQFNSPDYEHGGNLWGEQQYTYNAAGQLESISYYSKREEDNRLHLNQTVSYAYTPNGEIAYETIYCPDYDETNYTYYTYENSVVTEKKIYYGATHYFTLQYTYNSKKQLSEEKSYSAVGESQSIHVYHYEQGLNTRIDYYLDGKKERLGYRINREYDQSHNLAKETFSDIDILIDGDFSTRLYEYF